MDFTKGSRTLSGMQRKMLPLIDVKARKDGDGGFEGYGACFNNIDSYGDIIVPGAFKGTIESFLRDGFCSVGHSWSDLAVGTFSEAREDDKGLYVVAEYHSDDFSQRTRKVVNERIERGKRVGLSIGFAVKEGGALWAQDSDGFGAGVRILKDLELFEVAIVNVPANPESWTTVSKSQTLCEDAQCGCRLGGSHHSGLKFADHGEALLGELRGYTERARALVDARTKQQRTTSEVQVERVTAIASEMRTALELIEGLIPAEEVGDDEETRKSALQEIARYEILRAREGAGAVG